MPPVELDESGAGPHREGAGLQRRRGPRERRPRVVPPRGARARRLAARPELLAGAARQRHRLPAAQRHAAPARGVEDGRARAAGPVGEGRAALARRSSASRPRRRCPPGAPPTSRPGPSTAAATWSSRPASRPAESSPSCRASACRWRCRRALGTMTWLGRGPHENYWDRHTGAAVGRYSGRVEDLVHDYVRPQENGNRTDVRWVALTDADGAGLLASGLPLLSVSAWPYTMEDLEKATHVNELPRRDTITLNLDLRQMGVGGDDGWGARPHAEYTLDAKPYAYRFRLRPYAPSMGPLDEVARRAPDRRNPMTQAPALPPPLRRLPSAPPSARRSFARSPRERRSGRRRPPAVIDLSSNENPYGPSAAALEAMTRSQAVAGALPRRGGAGDDRGDRAPPRREPRPRRPRLRLERDPAPLRRGLPRARADGGRGGADLRGRAALREGHEGRAGHGAAHRRLPPRPPGHGPRLRRARRPRLRLQSQQPDGDDRDRRRAPRLPRAGPADHDGRRGRGLPPLRRGPGLPLRASRRSSASPTSIVARTFSKIYGMAGMRLGYAVASTRRTRRRCGAQASWSNANAAVLAAAAASLADEGLVARQRERLNGTRRWLCAELARDGRRTIPSEANFVMIDDGRGREAADRGLRGPRDPRGPALRGPADLAPGHDRHARRDAGLPGGASARSCRPGPPRHRQPGRPRSHAVTHRSSAARRRDERGKRERPRWPPGQGGAPRHVSRCSPRRGEPGLPQQRGGHDVGAVRGRPGRLDARAARERRRTGRLLLSGVVFWVDRPTAGARYPAGSAVADGVRTAVGSADGDRQAAGSPPAHGASGCYFFFASWNAHMYCGARRLTYEWV